MPMYNTIDVPLVWDLQGSSAAKTHNVYDVKNIVSRGRGMRGLPANPKREIAKPLNSIQRLSRRRGARLIEVAMAALTARHRETYHFNHANPHEVYFADVGGGVTIAVTGLLVEYRFPLECTVGYLILGNGVPVGYGGASALFHQVNTGINIFDEYRGSEAAFLWVQVMRVFHQLFGCNRYVANPYQFGSGNREALRSGAFWFYYRLGYRPAERGLAELARAEYQRIQNRRGYRSDAKTLKRLAGCDMHLALPGARRRQLFKEPWLELCAAGATEFIARQGHRDHNRALTQSVDAVVRALGMKRRQFNEAECIALRLMSPIVGNIGLESWSLEERKALMELICSKGGRYEIDYARRLREHERLHRELRRFCQRAKRRHPQN